VGDLLLRRYGWITAQAVVINVACLLMEPTWRGLLAAFLLGLALTLHDEFRDARRSLDAETTTSEEAGRG
jgi:hypothetical protein